MLLYTAFMHLLPEVRHEIENLQEQGKLFTIGQQSLTEFLFIIGFILVYLIEELVHAALAYGNNSCSDDPLHRTMSVRCTKPGTAKCSNDAANDHAPSRISLDSFTSCCEGSNDVVRLSINNGFPRNESNLTQNKVVSHNTLPKGSAKSESKFDFESLSKNLINPGNFSDETATPARGFLTILALSFHAIFEGLPVGFAGDVVSMWNLAGAIATHKLVIAFCIGMELLHSGISIKRMFSYLFVFAIVTPLGMGVGMILESQETLIIPTVLQALAAGTLLYVVFFEVLARERASNKNGLLHFFGLVVGFAVMFGIAFICEYRIFFCMGGGG